MEPIVFITFVVGFVLLLAGAELLVRGAANLAEAAGISALAVGLTVVAYGTSAPELAVSIQSNYIQPPKPDLAIGNIVGSNISNILLVLGLTAAIAPLAVSPQLVRRSLPLMIAISLLPLVMGFDGTISRWEGAALMAGAVAYTIGALVHSRRETLLLRGLESADGAEPAAARPPFFLLRQLLFIGIGLAGLLIGADWLVDGAVKIASALGVSELIIGLTIIAVGTSLPEMATSIVAAIRGQREIAAGNIVGSNIFNILLVLGGCAAVVPSGVAVSPPALRFDIPVMIAVSFACLPIFFTGSRIARGEGLLFLGYYVAYTAYLLLHAAEHDALESYSWAMLAVVAPATALALIGMTVFEVRQNLKKRNAASSQRS